MKEILDKYKSVKAEYEEALTLDPRSSDRELIRTYSPVLNELATRYVEAVIASEPPTFGSEELWKEYLAKLDTFPKIQASGVQFGDDLVSAIAFRSEAETEGEARMQLMGQVDAVLRQSKHVWVRFMPQVIMSEDEQLWLGYARIAYR